MSLATFAVYAEWNIQEMVDLLIAFRRKHGFDLKLRKDYYTNTFLRASSSLTSTQAMIELEELPNLPKDQKRAAAQKVLFSLLRIPIKRILQYLVEPAEYKLITDTACIHLGTVNNLIEQPYVRRKIADATKIYMPSFTKGDWQKIAQALLDLCEVIEAGYETGGCGQVKYWLTRYLQYHEPLYDRDDAQYNQRPFFYDNYLYLFGPEFKAYIFTHCKESLTPKGLGIALKEYGFSGYQMNFKRDNAYISRALWRMEIAKDQTIKSFVNQELLENANRIHSETAKEKDTQKDSVDDY
jgi:hypothetical protein